MQVPVFNPGCNCLTAGAVDCSTAEQSFAEANKLVEVMVGKLSTDADLSVYDGMRIAHSEAIRAGKHAETAMGILDWLDGYRSNAKASRILNSVDCIGVCVLNSGSRSTRPAKMDAVVEREITELTKWAPLHNMRFIEIVPSNRNRFVDPSLVVFLAEVQHL